jgi:type IV secretory pathway VirB10-like protein
LGVVAILGAAWIYQPFTRPDEPKRYQGPPPTWDPNAKRYEPPKAPPPKPDTPAPPTDADKRLDEVADETIARYGEMNELLGSAKDAASSAAAIAKVTPLLGRVGELERERRTLQSQGARLSPQKQQQLDDAQRAFESQQLRRATQQMPQYFKELDDLLKEVSPGGAPKKQP